MALNPCPCRLSYEEIHIEGFAIEGICRAPLNLAGEICGTPIGFHPRTLPPAPVVPGFAQPVYILRLEEPFPPVVLKKSRSPRGSIHGSTIITGGDEDEKETLRIWFKSTIADPQHFELPKPEEDERQVSSSWRFQDYQSAIEDLPLGLKVWDIQYTRETTSIVLQDPTGLQKEVSGRADFIISSNSASCQGAVLPHAQCVVEIQSSKHSEINCEYQMVTYLVLLMNRFGFPRLAGILVYNNGTCRGFRASRVNGNVVYQQNDTFPLYQIAEILPILLSFD